MVTRGDLQAVADAAPDDAARRSPRSSRPRPIVAYPDESLRMIVYRMAETGLTRFPGGRPGAPAPGRHDCADRPAEGAGAEPRCGTAARARARRAHQLPFPEQNPRGSPPCAEGHVSMPRGVPPYAGRSLTGCGGGAGNDAFAPPWASPANSASRLGYAYIVGAWSCINPPVSAVGP